jgi:hypothetical protein
VYLHYISRYYFLHLCLLKTKLYVENIYHWRIRIHVDLPVCVIVFGRGVSIFNFQIIHLMKVVYFSQIHQVHCRILITRLVGIKIKRYLIFTFARNNFISFLEIIAFQRLRINIFIGKILKNYMHKYHFEDTKTYPPAAYVQFM